MKKSMFNILEFEVKPCMVRYMSFEVKLDFTSNDMNYTINYTHCTLESSVKVHRIYRLHLLQLIQLSSFLLQSYLTFCPHTVGGIEIPLHGIQSFLMVEHSFKK